MSDSNQLRTDAREILIQLKRGAIYGSETPKQWRLKVDLLRDLIVSLANKLEFGYVAELSNDAMRILEQAALQNKASRFKISHEDMLYLVNTFPSAPDGLTNFISSNFNSNLQIVSSVVRANHHTNTHYLADCFLMMHKLAKADDLDSWIVMAKAILEIKVNTDLVLRTFSIFDNKTITAGMDKLEFMIEAIAGYKPGYFDDHFMGLPYDFENLLANLHAINERCVAHNFIATGKGDFTREFTLQRYMADYDFIPSESYRVSAIRTATAKHPDPKMKFQPVSYLAYDLGIDDPLVGLVNTPTASLVKSVLDLDGTESPYGKIVFNKSKVSQFLDETFKLALKDTKDWDKAIKPYRILGEKVLMQSNIYKGRRLESDLGM